MHLHLRSMKNNQNQQHPVAAFYYSLSIMFERASFYGVRLLIVIYMIEGALKMDRTEAISIYGWLIGLMVLARVIGALIGDLMIGNRKAVFVGGLLQAIGAFTLCLPSVTGLYTGLFLIVLGNGLYTPNLTSIFGKTYLQRPKLMDAGFAILHLFINLGAFIGVALIGYYGGKMGHEVGFVLAGILMLLSLVLTSLAQEKEWREVKSSDWLSGKNLLTIAVALIVAGFFWLIPNVLGGKREDLLLTFKELMVLYIPESWYGYIDTILVFPVAIIAIVLWSLIDINKLFKLGVGVLFALMSTAILFMIPAVPNESYILIYSLSLLFMSIAEIHIVPIMLSVVTSCSNPKYLAIIISLVYLLTHGLVVLGSWIQRLLNF